MARPVRRSTASLGSIARVRRAGKIFGVVKWYTIVRLVARGTMSLTGEQGEEGSSVRGKCEGSPLSRSTITSKAPAAAAVWFSSAGPAAEFLVA